MHGAGPENSMRFILEHFIFKSENNGYMVTSRCYGRLLVDLLILVPFVFSI